VFRDREQAGILSSSVQRTFSTRGLPLEPTALRRQGPIRLERSRRWSLQNWGFGSTWSTPMPSSGTKRSPSKLWDLVGEERMKITRLDFEGLKEYYRQRNLSRLASSQNMWGTRRILCDRSDPDNRKPPFRSTAGSPPPFEIDPGQDVRPGG